jgi:hypothetical protein
MSTATTSDKFTTDKYTQIRGELRAVLGHGATGADRHRPPRGSGDRPLPPQPRLRRADQRPARRRRHGDPRRRHPRVPRRHRRPHLPRRPCERRPQAARSQARPGPDRPRVRQQGPPRRRLRQGARDRRPQRRQGVAAPHARRVRPAAIASDPAGIWLVVGGDRGTLSVFDCEDKDKFFAAESKKLHEGAITGLMFEPEELRVTSVGADNKMLTTHVRGELEAEDRGGKNGHSERHHRADPRHRRQVLHRRPRRTIKTWTRGAGQRRPSTQKEGLAKVVALTIADFKGRPHIVAACKDNTLRLFPVDAGGKVGDRIQLFHGAHTWAEYELKRRDPKLREVSLRALAGVERRRLAAAARRARQLRRRPRPQGPRHRAARRDQQPARDQAARATLKSQRGERPPRRPRQPAQARGRGLAPHPRPRPRRPAARRRHRRDRGDRPPRQEGRPRVRPPDRPRSARTRARSASPRSSPSRRCTPTSPPSPS